MFCDKMIRRATATAALVALGLWLVLAVLWPLLAPALAQAIAWPQIVGLIASAIVLFVAGYVVFQRREVRA